jgi:hypothetical protein
VKIADIKRLIGVLNNANERAIMIVVVIIGIGIHDNKRRYCMIIDVGNYLIINVGGL